MSVVVRKKSVFNGQKLPENKFTAHMAIEKLPLPEKVTIPLQQNIGAPCISLVNRGDKVKTGQKIADSKSYVSAPIHAPVSGVVSRNIKVVSLATSRLIDAVVITSDGTDEWVELEQLPGVKSANEFQEIVKIVDPLPGAEMLKKIREAGVVGLGGATFPTHVKLSPPPDKKIDTLILNGCECEPYITSDHRVLLEYSEKVLAGLYIISKIISPENVYIAIEDNKKDAMEHLENLIIKIGLESNFNIISLNSKYPMGAEKTLIKTILGREVPIGGLPLDVGTIVNNVVTAVAVYEAVVEGRPLISTVVTVTGSVKDPKNLLVRIGTPVSSLINFCGGISGKANELIIGGPMMGIAITDTDFPVVKGTNCILLKEGRETIEQNCIKCGRCIKACPMNLMPLMFARYAKSEAYEYCKEYYIDDCIECGACAYVCPSNIPIVGYVKAGKEALSKK